MLCRWRLQCYLTKIVSKKLMVMKKPGLEHRLRGEAQLCICLTNIPRELCAAKRTEIPVTVFRKEKNNYVEVNVTQEVKIKRFMFII